MPHVVEELLGQNADIRFVQPGRLEDVDDLGADHGLAQNLPQRVFFLLVAELLVLCGVLGQGSLGGLQEGQFVPVFKSLVKRAAQRERLGGGQDGVGEALLAVILAQDMVGHLGQQLPGLGAEVRVVAAVQDAVEHLHLLQQQAQGLVGVDGRPPLAVGQGVVLQGGLELVGNADVVDDQTAGLVLEHPVDPGDGLHQVVATHGLVDIHRVQTGRIEAGQPHVAHDDQLERVGRVLVAPLQALLDLFGVDVRLEHRLVRGRAGHDDFDGAFVGVGVVPFRPQGDESVVEMDANLAAHADDHGLTVQGGKAVFEVFDDVGGHLLNPGRCANEFFQRGPAAQLAGLAGVVLIVLGQLVDVIIKPGGVLLREFELRQARLVIDGHRGAVLDRLLDVVDVDVVAEHGAGVAVLQRHGGAGEGDEGGVGQRVAQVLGVAVAHAGGRGRCDQGRGGPNRAGILRAQRRGRGLAVATGGIVLSGQLGGKAVLAAVGFVADDDDVAALGQHREAVFVLARCELLDGGEDDAAAGAVAQQLAQLGAGGGLHRGFVQQLGGAGEHAEQLVVQVVAVGDHQDRGVLELRVPDEHAGQAGHLDALASPLGVPHHPALARAARGAGLEHAVDHGAHGMELVVAGDLLDQPPIVLEQDEVLQIVEQGLAVEGTLDQGFQFAHGPERVGGVAVDGAPGHEAFPVGGERAHAGGDAVGDDQQLVVDEQVGNVVFVGLELVEGAPDVGVLVAGVLEFQHHQGQAVEEQHEVGAAGVLGALHGELVDGQPVVSANVAEVDEPDAVAAGFAVPLVLDRDTFDQPAVELAVGGDEAGGVGVED